MTIRTVGTWFIGGNVVAAMNEKYVDKALRTTWAGCIDSPDLRRCGK